MTTLEIKKMKDQKYIRKDKNIITIDCAERAKNVDQFKSINLAKKESHRLQMSENSMLGLGILQVK